MLLGRVARMYYEHGLTHQEIADALGLSRIRVTRLLAEARETGLVTITVNVEESAFADVEAALVDRYGLARAWVSPTVPDLDKSAASFGLTGADALAQTLSPQSVVALGLSREVAAAVAQLAPMALGATFVPVVGSSAGLSVGVNPHELALTLASLTSSRSFHLPAPMVASSAASAATAYSEPGVQEVLDLAEKADVLIAGVGGIATDGGLLIASLDDADRDELRAAGAVGDIGARFYGADGAAVVGGLDRRVVGLQLDQMLAIPTRLVLARGPRKVDALRPALEHRLITALVTDSRTADALLDDAR